MHPRLGPVLVPCLVLAGCASPAPEFFGATRTDLVLSGLRFTVFQKGERAEVIRLDYLTLPQRAGVQTLMMQAAEQASGCRVERGSFTTGVPGDTGEARMDLDCSRAGPGASGG
ncbi:hypothetical protein [Frigidibacter sp. MR17.24]|uniref:hypothetical protein n=1 Tax=Frigidibacter sp. MR17.24 TaxID=3127345 RepID=UPI003012C99B